MSLKMRRRVTEGHVHRSTLLHLHGHFFRLVNTRGLSSLKDTVLVDPMGRRDVVFQADHRGRWMFHCHHAYHMEAGMARIVDYV